MGTSQVPKQIGDLPPIGRPANSALLAKGLTTVNDVAAFGRKNLQALHGVGPKAIRLLEEAMTAKGIALAE